MQQLLQFLFRYRSFLLFLFLEIFSFWLIVQNNSYQGAKYFNSTNAITAWFSESSNDLRNFFDLPNQNQILADENSRLKEIIRHLPDGELRKNDLKNEVDSSTWKFIPAKVINNSVFLQNNHITVNKGSRDGVYKGMGVVGTAGAVGQVIAVSSQFSSIASLLHGSSLVSSMHKPSGSLCTTSWDGVDPLYANVQYLPRHLSLSQGDTIFTSGYNSVYPYGTLIGMVESASIAQDATFYDVKVKLSTDFYQLSYVYLANFRMRGQKDSLENVQGLRYE